MKSKICEAFQTLQKQKKKKKESTFDTRNSTQENKINERKETPQKLHDARCLDYIKKTFLDTIDFFVHP